MTDETMPPPGSVALVTGAGSGIGRATAVALGGIGCRVICAGRRLERVRPVAERLGENGHALALDVADPDSVDGVLDRLPEDWRMVRVLVNNAGHDVGGRRLFHEGSAEEWESILRTNVLGLVRVTRAIVPGMVGQGGGHIVNIGSTSGLQPVATESLYCTSKYAVHGFSETLRLDYADTGIRVTEILPGMVRTEFAGTRFDDPERGDRYYDDFGVCLAPADVAATVAFAVRQPAHVVISQLAVVPISQR